METNGYMQDGAGQQDDFDLAQLDGDFEHAPVEDREFEEPPDGRYQVMVDKVELARSKTSGAAMLKWQMKIIGGRCAGRYIFRNNMIASPENVKWLKRDLATCGMDVNAFKLSELPEHLGELLDVTLDVQKRTNGDYVNVYLNRRIEIDVPADFSSKRGDGGGGDDMMPF